MKSMTGFGRGGCVSRGTRYSVEISTVNRRNAELVFNLPRELAQFENLLRPARRFAVGGEHDHQRR